MRTSGDDAYNEWVYNISMVAGPKLNSVRTLLFNNDKASTEPEVLEIIGNAEAIFFAGGDQSVYLDYWAGTEVQSIIQSKLATVTVGGTSAGLAILGNWVYAADTGSIDTEAAMENPYDREIHIVSSFLTIPYLSSIITDTHFGTCALIVVAAWFG
jgi:cyanophycinase